VSPWTRLTGCLGFLLRRFPRTHFKKWFDKHRFHRESRRSRTCRRTQHRAVKDFEKALACPLFYGLHQILKIRKDVGVGFVPVLRHHFTIYDHIEFPMRSRGEFEAADLLTHPAQCFSCHPGSTQGMASIPTVKNLQFQLVFRRHQFPPTGVNDPFGQDILKLPA